MTDTPPASGEPSTDHPKKCGCVSHQAVELMQSGCPEDAAFYWSSIIVKLREELAETRAILDPERPGWKDGKPVPTRPDSVSPS